MYFPFLLFQFQTVTFSGVKDLVWHDPAILASLISMEVLDKKYVISSLTAFQVRDPVIMCEHSLVHQWCYINNTS